MSLLIKYIFLTVTHMKIEVLADSRQATWKKPLKQSDNPNFQSLVTVLICRKSRPR